MASMIATQPIPTCRRCSLQSMSPLSSLPLSMLPASLQSNFFESFSRFDAGGPFGSGPHSRGESCSSLELEALAAVHQLSFAVQNIHVSEMLPRTRDLIFVNVTTLEGQPYCLELTNKGWRITSLRQDCMQGDFTRMELFTVYYESLFDLMELISPGYKQLFNEKLANRLRYLQEETCAAMDDDESCMPDRLATQPLFKSLSPSPLDITSPPPTPENRSCRHPLDVDIRVNDLSYRNSSEGSSSSCLSMETTGDGGPAAST
ncbi:GSK3-beta interaction protein [Ditylenchus destructor]|nr:GSK3-beta interaction protein [Ditylenchus destructor]